MAKRQLEIATGVAHEVPMDLREALTSDLDIRSADKPHCHAIVLHNRRDPRARVRTSWLLSLVQGSK